MNGLDLMWKSELHGLTYKPSDKDNHVIILSSYEKIKNRFNYIKTEFKNAVIVNIDDEFGYGLFEINLIPE